jgi:prolyl-tRNA synthetase
MMHSDDDGLVLPPRIAPTQIVILPITPKEETRARVLETCDALALQLRGKHFADAPLEVEVDKRDLGGGVKNWEWIKKGVPIRVEIGPRDLEKSSVEVSRRDQSGRSKQSMSVQEFAATAPELLTSIQQDLYDRAKKFQEENTHTIESKKEFYDFFTAKNPSKPEIHGGFVRAHWNGSRQVEEQIKEDLKVTIRVVPFDGEPGKCIFTGESSAKQVIWSRRTGFISAAHGIKALQPRMVFVVHRRQGVFGNPRLPVHRDQCGRRPAGVRGDEATFRADLRADICRRGACAGQF